MPTAPTTPAAPVEEAPLEEEIPLEPKKVFVVPCDSHFGSNVSKAFHDISCPVSGIFESKPPPFLKWGHKQDMRKRVNSQKEEEDKAATIAQILDSDIIVTTVHQREAFVKSILKACQAAGPKEDGTPRVFIAVTTPLTWARTQPSQAQAAMESELGETLNSSMPMISERDELRRKGTPSARYTTETERIVLRATSAHLKTYVVCPGLIYGNGENETGFLPLFKAAWEGNQERTVKFYSGGENYVPKIHVEDLSQYVISTGYQMPSQQYLLAVDNEPTTLKDIAQTVTEAFGFVPPEDVSREDMLMMKNIESLILDLPMKPSAFLDPPPKLKFESGLKENMEKVKASFVAARGLAPLRLLMFGPPCSGKSSLAATLAKKYSLPIITAPEIVAHLEVMTAVEEVEELPPPPEGSAGAEGAEEDALPDPEYEALKAEHEKKTAAFEEATAKAKEFREAIEAASPGAHPVSGEQMLADEHMVVILKDLLDKTPAYLNQGFILDGFPKTLEAATALFTEEIPVPEPEEGEEAAEDKPPSKPQTPGEGEGGEEAEEEPKETHTVLPAYAISHCVRLDCSADEQALRLEKVKAEEAEAKEAAEAAGEEVSQADKKTGKMKERAEKWAALHGEGSEAPKFGDFLQRYGMPTYTVSAEDNTMENGAEGVLEGVLEHIGRPHNFAGFIEPAHTGGPSTEELQEKERLREEAAKRVKEQSLQDDKIKYLMNLQDQDFKAAREHQLSVRSKPVRKLLLQVLMPTITAGLIEICKSRPEDPVDALSEVLRAKAIELRGAEEAKIAAAIKAKKDLRDSLWAEAERIAEINRNS